MAQLYESIFILRPSLSEEETQKVVEKVTALLEKAGGRVERLESWGKRKLAYEVKREKKGIFLQLRFHGNGAVVTELERMFRLDDAVMKFHTVRLNKQDLSAAPAPVRPTASQTPDRPGTAEEPWAQRARPGAEEQPALRGEGPWAG